MDKIKVQWTTDDADLNSTLSRSFKKGFEVSPYELFIFRNRSWITSKGEAAPNATYGHFVKQESSYSETLVTTLCGDSFSLYGLSDIYPMVDISPLNDMHLCYKCAISAEFIYWYKLNPKDEIIFENKVDYGC